MGELYLPAASFDVEVAVFPSSLTEPPSPTIRVSGTPVQVEDVTGTVAGNAGIDTHRRQAVYYVVLIWLAGFREEVNYVLVPHI